MVCFLSLLLYFLSMEKPKVLPLKVQIVYGFKTFLVGFQGINCSLTSVWRSKPMNSLVSRTTIVRLVAKNRLKIYKMKLHNENVHR